MSNSDRQKTIFVSVAAFCDPWLRFTIDGLFAKAEFPQRLRVAVVDQSQDQNRAWLEQAAYWSQVGYVNLHPVETRGVSWARNIAFSLYGGEDYLLQIDSHTHFDQGWESRLIELLESCRARAERPIISTYPPPFEFDQEGQPCKKSSDSNYAMILRPHPDTHLSPDNATLRFRAEYVLGGDFVEGHHLAAGFIFTLGDFVEEIPYDPFMYFHGEEQNLAIRAYTHGWQIFHPRQRDIPLAHLYKQSGVEHRTHHWHPDYEKQRAIKWVAMKKRADQRLRELVYGPRFSGAYGLGRARTMEQFARESGIDYPNRRLAPLETPPEIPADKN